MRVVFLFSGQNLTDYSDIGNVSLQLSKPKQNRFNIRGRQCFCLTTSFHMADKLIPPLQECLTVILEVTSDLKVLRHF